MSSDFRIHFKIEGHGHQFDLIEATPDRAEVTLNGVSYALYGDSESMEIRALFLAQARLSTSTTIEGLLENMKAIAAVEEVSITTVRKTNEVGVSSLNSKRDVPNTADRIRAAGVYLDGLRGNPRFSGVVLIGVGNEVIIEEVFQPDSVVQKLITSDMPWNVRSKRGKAFRGAREGDSIFAKFFSG